MTVEQLIKILQNCNPKDQVVIQNNFTTRDIEVVKPWENGFVYITYEENENEE